MRVSDSLLLLPCFSSLSYRAVSVLHTRLHMRAYKHSVQTAYCGMLCTRMESHVLTCTRHMYMLMHMYVDMLHFGALLLCKLYYIHTIAYSHSHYVSSPLPLPLPPPPPTHAHNHNTCTQVSTEITLEQGNTNAIQPPKFQLNDSSVVPEPPGPVTVQVDSPNKSDSPDGLPTSFTASDLHSPPRPLSVFSTGSSVSSSGSYQEGLVVQSLPTSSVTLPRLRSRPHDQDQLGRDRALSVGSAMNRKRAIGINHFNRLVIL